MLSKNVFSDMIYIWNFPKSATSYTPNKAQPNQICKTVER